MRIRKKAVKILCESERLGAIRQRTEEGDTYGGAEMQVCELNQSPWDAMSFTPPLRSEGLRSFEDQEMEDDNAIVGGSIETSLTEEIEEEPEPTAACGSPSHFPAELAFRRRVKIEAVIDSAEAEIENKGRISKKRRGRKKIRRKKPALEEGEDFFGKTEMEASASPSLTCKKTDGKGWYCKREAHHPHSLCEYHLIQVRSYYTYGSGAAVGPASSVVHPPRACRSSVEHTHDRKRPARKKANNNGGGGGGRTSDFYYYSGFGPWWGKKRNKVNGDVEEVKVQTRFDDQAADYVELGDGEMNGGEALEDDDDDGADDSGKRRGRKPIKARSLKSLL